MEWQISTEALNNHSVLQILKYSPTIGRMLSQPRTAVFPPSNHSPWQPPIQDVSWAHFVTPPLIGYPWKKCSSSWGCWLYAGPAYGAVNDTDGNQVADGGGDSELV